MSQTFKEKETILVVDDNRALLEMVVSILQSENFRVLSADNGPAALEVAKEVAGNIDLLLSDVDMPRMSGPVLGESLKQLMPDMQVMLMSGGSDLSWTALRTGWTYIQKPFGPGGLVQIITDVLRSTRPSPEPSGI